MLTFIAEYPNNETIKDGMMIRIKEIDSKYDSINRRYLDIGYFRNVRPAIREEHLSDTLTIYHLNFFIHFFSIISKVKDAKSIYIHTIFNYAKVSLFVSLFFKDVNLAIDLHGVIPEELKFQGAKMQSLFYGFIEKIAIARANHLIYVTNSMKEHFGTKYKLEPNDKRDIVLGVVSKIDAEESNNKSIDLGFAKEDVVFIYSGGIQKWQNIHLMLETIKALTNVRYKFLFLTGSPDYMKSLIDVYNLTERITVLSVHPNELATYYLRANYGFVLRDDNVVNRVSNPTKLSEYLAFGIMPIVLSEHIGDYNKMGYEFIEYNNLNNEMLPVKSEKNKGVYANYYKSLLLVKYPFLQD